MPSRRWPLNMSADRLRDEGHRDDLVEAQWLGERQGPIAQPDRLGHLLVAECRPPEGLEEESGRRVGLGRVALVSWLTIAAPRREGVHGIAEWPGHLDGGGDLGAAQVA